MSNPEKEQSNFRRKAAQDSEQIQGFLDSGRAFWVIAVIIVGVIGWSIVSTFL